MRGLISRKLNRIKRVVTGVQPRLVGNNIVSTHLSNAKGCQKVAGGRSVAKTSGSASVEIASRRGATLKDVRSFDSSQNPEIG
jgi:hypothetical protein